MAYILFSLSFLALIVGTILFFTRARWLPGFQQGASRVRLPSISFPGRDYLYSRLPSTFQGDIEAGLSSSTFDLSANVGEGDSRGGLDATAKREILKIMQKRRMQFDEARRVYMEERFMANGIGADGRPKDPKFVSFS